MTTNRPTWEMTDARLADLARQAFLMGLADGRSRATPRSGRFVARRLFGAHASDWLISDRLKLRQVYGAGFDMVKRHAGYLARKAAERPQDAR